MARIKWNKVDSDVRRMARELVEDPEYRAALRRRLADGKAPRMMRLLLQWPEQKARDPQELRRGKPPLTVVMKYLPGDPAGDSMREQTQRMIEPKAREEEEARTRHAAGERPATATPEKPSDPDQLEVYRDPPEREPYDPDR